MVDANVTGDASTERPERSKPLRTGSTVYIDMETESWSHDRLFFKNLCLYMYHCRRDLLAFRNCQTHEFPPKMRKRVDCFSDRVGSGALVVMAI